MALDTSTPMNSLGFAKPPSETRVVVAMSGGVDSSVVAAHLADQGYDVVGVTLQLYDHGAALAKKGACCAGIDIHDARRVAEERGFPHYVLDYENIFPAHVFMDFNEHFLVRETANAGVGERYFKIAGDGTGERQIGIAGHDLHGCESPRRCGWVRPSAASWNCNVEGRGLLG